MDSDNRPASDATLHPLMNTRHLALELAPGGWGLLARDVAGRTNLLASGKLDPAAARRLRLVRRDGRFALECAGKPLWSGPAAEFEGIEATGVLGLWVAPNSSLVVDRFQIEGRPKPARMSFLWTEGLLGAGESPADWEERTGPEFRFASGVVSKLAAARVKWNVVGCDLRLWSPRGPDFGSAQLLVDGRAVATLDFHADKPVGSQPVWSMAGMPDTPHAVVLTVASGQVPVDCLEVGNAPRVAR